MAFGKMKLIVLLVFVTVLDATFCSSYGTEQEQKPRVRTQNGIVEGFQSNTADINKVYYRFHGIPYAQPPINDLRFRPPVPASNWRGVYNATYERDICIQGGTAESDPIRGTEDCLHINVYTPQLPSTRKSKTFSVMVWIYGGGFTFGDASYVYYGPDFLLNDDVVVVTFNYRLGPFGFLSTEDLVVPGNNGLKDMVLALKWVQNNIAGFGGNPKSVTIFGESAGAGAVGYLVQTRLAKGLHHRAIFQSGTSLGSWALTRRAKEGALTTANILGINATDSLSLVKALKQVPYRQLQEASINATKLITKDDGLDLNGFVFGPVKEPEHEGALIVGRTYEMLRKGEFIRVPHMMGFTSEEANFAALISDMFSGVVQMYDSEVERLVPIGMNIEDLNVRKEVGEAIKRHYVGASGSFETNRTGFIRFVSDDQFVRPECRHADLISDKVDVYFYEFSYEGPLANPDRILKGVGHAEELNYLFRFLNGDKYQNLTDGDRTTLHRMVRMWTNFAKTGNPTPVSDPLLQGVKWKVSSATKDLTYLNIGENLTLQTNLRAHDVKFWSHLYRTYANPPLSTY